MLPPATSPEARPHPPTYWLVERAHQVARTDGWQHRILPAAPPETAFPAALVKPIAAGGKVVADRESPTAAILRQHYSDAVAVDMEAHGFLYSAYVNNIDALVVRGISDLLTDKTETADRHWQPVASSHAAAFAFELLDLLPPAGDIAKPGPWETTDEFFRPFTGASVFSHEWSLAGRTRELGSLVSFLENPAARLALLVGTGGMGKTRLLRQVALDVAEDQDVAVRFVAVDTAVEPAQFELLPVAGRLVIIIDDAHGRSDVAAIVRGVLRTRPHAQFVVAVRPYALSELTGKLRGAGILLDDCPIVRLHDLTLGEARVLAREVLGADATVALVEAVGGLAPDCPLIMVIAATLIRRGALDPVRLSASSRIRSEVMQNFTEAMTAGLTVGDPDMRREVLDAVAALQPFRIDDDVFRAAIVTLTGRSFDRVMPYLSGLEKAGVLLQRGTALRIVPDLLGDAILGGACVDTVSGVPLGYLERVYEAADGPALANLFVNACRVDWQINQDQQTKRSLVEPLWRQIEVQFADGDIDGRVAQLRLLGKVAAFQPQHTLALVERAVGSCSNDDDGEPGHRLAAADDVSRYRQILDELPPLLESEACHLDYLAPAAELLWRLAEHDARQTNQYPNHPIRVLCRLMEYSPMTPRQFHEELLVIRDSVFFTWV
jgi:hypothetical protein